MNGLKRINSYLNYAIALLLVISLFLLPDITVSNLAPKVSPIDFLLPFMGVSIIISRAKIEWNSFYTVSSLFGIYILFTMFINDRLHSISDHFEVFKLIKFIVVVVWSSTLNFHKHIKPFIKPVFILLSLINLLHFFELFHINQLIGDNYGGAKNITEFGLNSIGQLASKRMTGLAFNPNNNAIIFTFFAIYFLPLFGFERKYIYSIIALLLAFLCQSKTTFIVLLFILLLLMQSKKMSYKAIIKYAISIAIIYLISYLLCSRLLSEVTYSTSLFNGKITETGSARGRLESWNFLGKMIIEKPLFGHGPYKEFFYSNNLYSENEYILYTWRYGFIGLLFYLNFYVQPWFQIRKRAKQHLLFYTCIVLLFLTSSLTNNPFADRNIMLLFALTLGLLFKARVDGNLTDRRSYNE